MNGKSDFKQSEVGLIPNDWDVTQIQNVATLVNGRGFKPHEWKEKGLPIIRIQNLNGSEDFNYFEGAYNRKILVENKQLLFAWSGSRGTSFGPHIWHGGTALLNYHTWKVIVDDSTVSSDFFFFALKNLTKQIEDDAHGASALVHTQKGEMEKYFLPLPPLPEQTAIAEALSDADALITSLEKLIEKKRAIKQGAMQELLTGKRRLPGFSGEWEVKKLGEIGTIIRGASPRPKGDPRYYGGNIPRLMVEDVTRDGKFVTPTVDFLTKAGAEKSRPCKKGTLTIVCSGTVGIPAFLAVDACIHDGFLALINIRNDYSDDFIYHQLTTLQQKLENSATHGGVFTNLTSQGVREFEILMPDFSEQKAIAEILSDMDTEILTLEQKLAKYRQIKQGMMQELLTGRIRLVKPRTA